MPNIHQELVIRAARDRVYDALTTEHGLSGWWTPGVATTGVEGSVARFPFGEIYFKDMRITQLRRPELVQWHCVGGADEWVGTDLSFSLAAGDREALLLSHPEAQGQIGENWGFAEGTILDFTHANWRSDTPMFAECSYTWGQFLHSLKLFCETGSGRPSPNVHRTVAAQGK